MQDEALPEALAELYARESEGDFGARQRELRIRCRRVIERRLFDEDTDNFRIWISLLVRDMFLSDASLADGRGIEDLFEFWAWFDQRMWTGTPMPSSLAAAS